MERRSIIDARFPVSVEARIYRAEGEWFHAFVRNVSKRGFAMASSNDFTSGDCVFVEIGSLPRRKANVAWRHGERVGCEFHEPLTTAELATIGSFDEDLQIGTSDPLGETIRRLRHVTGVTQSELAEAIGTSRETIWSWETGKTRPAREKVFRLFSYLESMVDTTDAGSFIVETASEEGGREVRKLLDELRVAVSERLGIEPDCVDIHINIKPV